MFLQSLKPLDSNVFIADDAVTQLESFMLSLVNPTQSKVSEISSTARDAAIYHLASGGGRMRARLALHAAQSLGLSPDDAIVLASAAELLHNASLIHDDLHDNDISRRGAESVWVRYGQDIAICAGDYLLSTAYSALAHFSNPAKIPMLLACVHHLTACAIHGQSADVSLTGAQPISLAHYEQIARAKSGALLCLPVALAFTATDCDDETMAQIRDAFDTFAIGYQMMDDLADVANDAASTDGKATLNAVLILQASGTHDDAHAQVRRMAIDHLTYAATLATDFPANAGVLLQELAYSMIDSA